MTDPSRYVVIELRDIYDGVRRLENESAVVRGWMQSANDRAIDHEARLRVLERGRWPLPSLAALISVAALVMAVLNINK